jgi:hypothetical protein
MSATRRATPRWGTGQLISPVVVGGKSTPAPVIFQIGKGIFAIGVVAIKLRKGGNGMIERGDQHGIGKAVLWA